MSSSIDGISIPDPASYTANSSVPWGITNPVDTSQPASPSANTSIAQEYANLQQYDTAELLYASFLSPSAAIANGADVLEQGAALLDGLSSSGGTANASSTSSSSSSSSSSQSTPSSDVSNLPSYESLVSQSDAAAQAALDAYQNSPDGSSILDYQA